MPAKAVRYRVERRGAYWIIVAKPSGDVFVEVVGIFRSKDAAESEIARRHEWRDYLKRLWKDV